MTDQIIIKPGPVKIGELKAGEIQQFADGSWMLGCPRCGLALHIKDWKVVIKDNKVTVTPSIMHEPNGCHFIITDGKVQYCGEQGKITLSPDGNLII